MLEKSRLFTRRRRKALRKCPCRLTNCLGPGHQNSQPSPHSTSFPFSRVFFFFLNKPPLFLPLATRPWSSCSFWDTKNLEISAGALYTPIHTYYKVRLYLTEPLLPKDPLNIDKGWVREEPIGAGASICCADPDLQECCLLAGLRAGEGRWRRNRGRHRDI